MMITHFINNPDTFSNYVKLLAKVHPSKRSASTMHELLSARGNYTCFAPTNEAVQHHIDSLASIGELTSNDIDQVPDSVAEEIVFNSIIDNGNNEPYASTEFGDGPLTTNNMNERPIIIQFVTDSLGGKLVYINTHSRLVQSDIEVENGYIHVVDKVISPSNATVGDLIISTPNTRFFGELLRMTGWDQKMTGYRDYDYEDKDEAGASHTDRYNSGFNGKYPKLRKILYTVFVEPDSVFERYNINDVEALKDYLRANAYYDANTTYDNDYENEDNAVNQFVAYHLINVGLDWNNMVTWSNERGFYNGNLNSGSNSSFSINVWEYWETMGKHRRPLKITGIRGKQKRLNRKSIYNLTTYREITSQTEAGIPGITVNQSNGEYNNNSLNGYYFPINDILLWTEQVPTEVLNERMRYDICSLLPELINAGCRLNRENNWFFTSDYFSTMPYMSNETEFLYLSNTSGSGGASEDGGSWMNFQSDEFNIHGIADFVLKLPPVPYDGTYEIRYGLNVNNNRGMVQVYVGTNPNNLPAIGIPLDLRIGGSSALVGWQKDSELGSDEAKDEVDKQMRNNGYMKGPRYFWPGSGQEGRISPNCLRRIIYTGQLNAGETYYIRFKSVLNNTAAEFFFDYLEIVPKSVYNGDVSEDRW